MVKKLLFIGAISALISACGGGESSVSSTSTTTFTAISIFSDDALAGGVGRGTGSDGVEIYYIAPDIVNDVALSNASPVQQVDITDFPIVSVQSGYNIRQGTQDGSNVLVAEKIGSGKSSIAYIYNATQDAIGAGTTRPSSLPTGSHTYTGVYGVLNRGSDWRETGTLSLTANFNANTFSINASSTDTSLTGSGIIEPSTGRISGGSLNFSDAVLGNYSATTYGNIGETNGTEVTGIFHTNDTAPDFSGAYAGSR